MRTALITITLIIASSNAYAQTPRSYGQTRPQWGGYYNGYGVSPGYRYNPRSGWNTMTTPNGAWMHYRDGYVPLRPSRPRRYMQYNNNSYTDIMGGLIYGNGWQ